MTKEELLASAKDATKKGEDLAMEIMSEILNKCNPEKFMEVMAKLIELKLVSEKLGIVKRYADAVSSEQRDEKEQI